MTDDDGTTTKQIYLDRIENIRTDIQNMYMELQDVKVEDRERYDLVMELSRALKTMSGKVDKFSGHMEGQHGY